MFILYALINTKITWTIYIYIYTGNRWMFETKYTHFSKRTADYVSTTITTKQHHLLLSTTRQ